MGSVRGRIFNCRLEDDSHHLSNHFNRGNSFRQVGVNKIVSGWAYYVVYHVPFIVFAGGDSLHYEKFADGSVKCIEDEIPFDLPDGWAWSRLNCIVDVRDGTHDTPAYVEHGVPLITSKNLLEGGIDYTNVKYISENDAQVINERSGVDIGDILFAMIGTIGNPAMVSDGRLISVKNVALFKFSYSDKLSNRYMINFFDYAQEDMKKRPSGGLQPFVSLNYLRQYLVPVPPVDEQLRIVALVDNAIRIIQQVDKMSKELGVTTDKVKSKILNLAIRGQLVPQDPADEPASVLLERIRVEKEELIKQGKIKRDKKESVIFRGEDNSYYEKIGNELENIDDEIPFELPDGWAFVRLKELWELISGRDLSPSEYNADGVGIPYITGASNFVDGKVEVVRWTTSPQVITEAGDLLLTCKGTIGEMAFNDFGSAHIARQIMAIRNTFALNSEYLALCMSFYINAIKDAAKGLIPGISREDILNLILPVPSLNYQAKVVERAAEVTSILRAIEKSLS